MGIRRFCFAVLGLGLVACGDSSQQESPPPEATPASPLIVAAVNHPLQYFAQRIGGDEFEAILPVDPEVDPAFWEPTPEQVVVYQGADLVLLNGADYAKWVPKVSLPDRKLVDTSAGFHDRLLVVKDAVTHSHGPGEEHAHEGVAFTTWLDFDLAALQAMEVSKALSDHRPEATEGFQARTVILQAALESLDREMLEIGRVLDGRPLLGSHPVYQYLARRYGLNLVALTWEPDQTLDGRQWHDLEHKLRSHPAKTMLWESEPLEETRARLSEVGIECMVFDPTAQPPATGDWLTSMRANLDNLRAVADRP